MNIIVRTKLKFSITGPESLRAGTQIKGNKSKKVNKTKFNFKVYNSI